MKKKIEADNATDLFTRDGYAIKFATQGNVVDAYAGEVGIIREGGAVVTWGGDYVFFDGNDAVFVPAAQVIMLLPEKS